MIYNFKLQRYVPGKNGIIRFNDLVKRWGSTPLETMNAIRNRDVNDKKIPLYSLDYSVLGKDFYAITEWQYGVEYDEVCLCMDDVVTIENNIKAIDAYQDEFDENMLRSGEWVPVEKVRKLRRMTPMEMVDFLNTGQIETNEEQSRRDWAKSNGYPLDSAPFFTADDLNRLMFHAPSVISYMESLGAELDAVIDRAAISSSRIEDAIDLGSDKIARLESELAKACQEIERLKVEGHGKPPKTAGACEAAQASRVEEWKGYAAVMAKVAYQCGLKNKKDITRSKFEKMAGEHGGLSTTALNLLRDALPEVAKKTAGAPKAG